MFPFLVSFVLYYCHYVFFVDPGKLIGEGAASVPEVLALDIFNLIFKDARFRFSDNYIPADLSACLFSNCFIHVSKQAL